MKYLQIVFVILTLFAYHNAQRHVYAAGEAVSWDAEMQRPEARKALKKYVEENCQINVWYMDVPTEHGNVRSTLHLTCDANTVK